MKIKANVKVNGPQAIVKVKVFGEEIAEFNMRANDTTITSDVIVNYINTEDGDLETKEAADQIMLFMGLKVANMLIHDFEDKGNFLRELLEMAIDLAPTEQLRENSFRLRRIVLPLLGRVYFDATNKLTPKEQRKYCGYQTCESIVSTLLACSWISDGILSFSAEI